MGRSREVLGSSRTSFAVLKIGCVCSIVPKQQSRCGLRCGAGEDGAGGVGLCRPRDVSAVAAACCALVPWQVRDLLGELRPATPRDTLCGAGVPHLCHATQAFPVVILEPSLSLCRAFLTRPSWWECWLIVLSPAKSSVCGENWELRIPWGFENREETGIADCSFRKHSHPTVSVFSGVFTVSRPASVCGTSTD